MGCARPKTPLPRSARSNGISASRRNASRHFHHFDRRRLPIITAETLSVSPTSHAAPKLKWLNALEAAGTAEDMRRSLRARYPAFTPERLKNLIVVGAADEGLRLAALAETYGID